MANLRCGLPVQSGDFSVSVQSTLRPCHLIARHRPFARTAESVLHQGGALGFNLNEEVQCVLQRVNPRAQFCIQLRMKILRNGDQFIQ